MARAIDDGGGDGGSGGTPSYSVSVEENRLKNQAAAAAKPAAPAAAPKTSILKIAPVATAESQAAEKQAAAAAEQAAIAAQREQERAFAAQQAEEAAAAAAAAAAARLTAQNKQTAEEARLNADAQAAVAGHQELGDAIASQASQTAIASHEELGDAIASQASQTAIASHEERIESAVEIMPENTPAEEILEAKLLGSSGGGVGSGQVAVHTVAAGDTLSAIAARNGTDVETLVRLNNISNPDLIFPGQNIKLPFSGGGDAPAAAGQYTVVSGDTLIAIAARHGTDYKTIAKMNGIDNPDFIRTGQVIKLPTGVGGGVAGLGNDSAAATTPINLTGFTDGS